MRVLVDVDLTGLVVGATLATRTPEIYLALIEATAFGTRMIVDAFESSGVAVNEIVAADGLPERNQLLMQIYADLTDRVFHVPTSSQTPALGSAMFAAVAAGSELGGYESITDAAARIKRLRETRYNPKPALRAGIRRALAGVPRVARLLRARRQRGYEAAQGPAHG